MRAWPQDVSPPVFWQARRAFVRGEIDLFTYNIFVTQWRRWHRENPGR